MPRKRLKKAEDLIELPPGVYEVEGEAQQILINQYTNQLLSDPHTLGASVSVPEDDDVTTIHNENMDGALISNKRLIQEGSPHTTEDLIWAESTHISRKDAREVAQLMRKHDPYSILYLVRRLKEYRQRVKDLEARLKTTSQQEVGDGTGTEDV